MHVLALVLLLVFPQGDPAAPMSGSLSPDDPGSSRSAPIGFLIEDHLPLLMPVAPDSAPRRRVPAVHRIVERAVQEEESDGLAESEVSPLDSSTPVGPYGIGPAHRGGCRAIIAPVSGRTPVLRC